MKSTDHQELKQVIRKAYDTKLSLFIWGKIGIGKSVSVLETAQEIAKSKDKKFIEWNRITDIEKRKLLDNPENYFIFCDIRSSTLDPTDLKGLPNFYNGVVEWKSQLLFKTLENPKADGLIFFDEINLSPIAVLNSLFQIILDRSIGEISLNQNVGIIAGGNSSEESSAVFELPEPLRNRFIHIELQIPDIKGWTNWALSNQINPDIIGYLNWKPDRLYSFNKKNKDMSFATPRMWEFTSRLISNSHSLNEKETLISCAVGEGICIEMITFLKLKEKLDLDQYLNNPEKIKEIVEVDQRYALLGALAERYKSNPKVFKSCLGIARYLEPEFTILLLRYLLNMYKSNHPKETENETYLVKFSTELHKAGGSDFSKYNKYFI